MKDKYRWYLVNNQETCYMSIIALLPGWYSSKSEVKEAFPEYSDSFKEHLFSVRKIKESVIPGWLYSEIKKNNGI